MSLTAAQIVSLACQIAKCPGYTSQGGQYLNVTLRDLWLHRDLKINRKTQTLTVAANSNGPFNLETDYQRTYDLFYLNNNLPYFLSPASIEMYDQQFKDPSISNYPYMYSTDLSQEAQTASSAAGQIYIYPQSSGQLSLTHRYMCSRADITTPETSSTVPWFTDQQYLIDRVAAHLMSITDDERKKDFEDRCEAMLRTHLIQGEGDEQKIVNSVKLDPWRFRNNRALKPTKTDSF